MLTGNRRGLPGDGNRTLWIGDRYFTGFRAGLMGSEIIHRAVIYSNLLHIRENRNDYKG